MANPAKCANCGVLGDGTGASDSAHVSKRTPMQTKKEQMLSAKEAGINPVREKATTAERRGGNARPLDGGIARK